MTDYFELLGEPRRPWVDREQLKTRVLALSAQVHPDRFHSATEAERRAAGARFAELNAAARCIGDTKERLQHLLALERGGKNGRIHTVPAQLSSIFTDVAGALRSSEDVLRGKAAATSPMLKLQAMQRALDCAEQLRVLHGQLAALREAGESELEQLNATWEAAPAPHDAGREAALPLDSLERICSLLSFVGRWSAQLQERAVQLTM